MGEKKRILFYGDSNTYGYDPFGDYWEMRYPASVRWPDRLVGLLPSWEILPEGLNGRRIPRNPSKDGYSGLPLERLGPGGYFS